MKNRLKKNERDAIKDNYRTSELLYRLIEKGGRKVQKDMSKLNFTVEELFYEVMSILDDIKEDVNTAEDKYTNCWDNLYCDIRDLSNEYTPDEELRLAASEIVYVALLLMSMCDGFHYANMSTDFISQLNSCHPGVFEKLNTLFLPELHSLGEEQIVERIQSYMKEDEWISDDIKELIGTLEDESDNVALPAQSFVRIAGRKKTSVIILLDVMYKLGWFVDNDGKNLKNRDKSINEILKFAFGEEKDTAIAQTIKPSGNIDNERRIKKIVDEIIIELEKYVK